MAWCSDCAREAHEDAASTFSAAVTACGSLVSGSNDRSAAQKAVGPTTAQLHSLPVEQALSRSSPSGRYWKAAQRQNPAKEVLAAQSTREEVTHELLAISRNQGSAMMSAGDFREMVRAATSMNEEVRSKPSARLSSGSGRRSFAGLFLKEAAAAKVDAIVWRGILLLLSLLAICTVSFIVAFAVLGNQVGDELTIVEPWQWVGTPENLVDALRGQCVALKQQASPLLERIEEYNRQHGFREVGFLTRSRKQARAIFLPNSSLSPRVVVVHGRRSHGLASAAQAAGYFLRLSGISALIIEDLAVARENASSWLLDDDTVLVAWDYAAEDPQSLLGGALPANQVAVMGFDFGGFAAQRAFLREPRIRTLLVDGVVHDFEALIREHVVRLLGSWSSTMLRNLLTQQVKSRCEFNLQTRLSEASLSGSFADRTVNNGTRIGIFRSEDDAVIPGDEQYDLLTSAVSMNGQIESVSWSSTYTGPSSDACNKQRALHLSSPTEYQAQLCEFFADAFALGVDCR